MTGLNIVAAALLVVSLLSTAGATRTSFERTGASARYGHYAWPVRGPVLHGFEAPAGAYGPGHRGIDIGAPFGSRVVAAHDGVVAFSGWIAGSLFLSIDHPDGIRTTYSWLLEVTVRKGDRVKRGEAIARTGHGHPGDQVPHLHFGARVGDAYIDPMLLLEQGSVAGLIHLAPLEAA
jgi:murein DD-endopeptidase MepM/ murein hydrolase activator NlpD